VSRPQPVILRLPFRSPVKVLRRGWRKWWERWRALGNTAIRLAPYLQKRKGKLGLALILGLAYTLVGLVEPWTLKLILDNVLLGHPLPPFLEPVFGRFSGDRILLLNALVGVIVVLAIARAICYYFQKLLAARVGQEATAHLRLDLYRHLQGLSFNFHERRRTGDMLARLTSDIRYIREIFISLPLSLTSEVALVLGMLTIMLWMDWQLTLMAMAVLPLIAVLLRTYQIPMKSAIRRQRDREGDLATLASEVLGAINVVQGFRREQNELDRFTVLNKRSLRTGLKTSRLEAKLRGFSEVAVAIVTALVMAVAARRVLTGALSPGDLVLFVTYLRHFNRPLRRVSSMAERAARGSAAGDRVLEMLVVEPSVKDLPGAVRCRKVAGQVAFEGVTFRRRGNRIVLSDIDLLIRPGERVAIVGPTGSGKTTLASLIPRFHDPSEGRVTLDGQDLRKLTLASLRDQIAIVFQEPVLFATTILENIGFGRPNATREEIEAAAIAAGIAGIIEALPEGYDTELGERGGTLSGGERQCVAIARAMVRNAPVVLLDEPTSGLDARSSSLVISALERLMVGRTVLMISHQTNTLRNMDRILVLEEGRIVDEGSPAVLLDRQGLFRTFQRLSQGREVS